MPQEHRLGRSTEKTMCCTVFTHCNLLAFTHHEFTAAAVPKFLSLTARVSITRCNTS
jgi:hypothetical protein